MSLKFKNNLQSLTIGVEIELQVLSKENLLLTPRAAELIHRCGNEKFKQEFFQSTLEIITGVHEYVQGIEADLQGSIDTASRESKDLNLVLGSTGTHPLADYRDRLVTPSPRYHELIDRNQWLIRRMAVYGMHVHLGMSSGDMCIAFNNFFVNFVPHILALSASSPFWQGMHTGLSSCRPTTYEALPTAGMPYLVKDWSSFENLFLTLVKSDAIQTFRDLWWDIRPSPALGTLEIRCCDEPATLAEILGITAFVHLLAHWFLDHMHLAHQYYSLDSWILRENKWRALRNGVRAQIIVGDKGNTKPLKDDIQEWLQRLEPYARRLEYGPYLKTIFDVIEHGTSAERQFHVFSTRQNLHDVVAHNVKEFQTGRPLFV